MLFNLRLQLLLVFIAIVYVECEETTTIPTTIINNQNASAASIINQTNINNISMERIVQPFLQQTTQRQIQIDPQQQVPVPSTHSKIKINSSSIEFRPSPQLETYFEYNKFPVIPAFPESKHIAQELLHGAAREIPFENQKHRRQQQQQWHERSAPVAVTTATEQSPWYSRVKFPSTGTGGGGGNINERPYQFEHHQPIHEKSHSILLGENGGVSLNKPVPSSNGDAYYNNNNNKVPGLISGWDKFEQNSFVNSNRRPYNPYNKPSYHPTTIGTDHGLLSPEKPYSVDPWKKIIKFLTTFLPIGLLISALTPTVITVQAVNDTNARLRADDQLHQRFVSSLDYFNKLNENGCEDRILCELLLSASTSKDAEQHVANLLDTFTDNGRGVVEKAAEMRKIFESVRNQDCAPIVCDKIRENR